MAKKLNANKTNDATYIVKVIRMYAHEGGNISFDADVNGVKCYGMAMIWQEEKEEYFISFPSRKGKDGKYYKHLWFPVSDELQENIFNQIAALNAEGK